MALARLRRKTEATLADDNCAFNAFALGICNVKILRQLEMIARSANALPDERFKSFIRNAAAALKVEATWANIKNELQRLRRDDAVLLQHLLAPVLRELAYDLAIKPADAEFHYKQTEIFFMSAFRDYYRRYRGLNATYNDDIFQRHEFIRNEFARVCRLDKSKPELIEEIKNWWRERGYATFLQVMRQDKEWAGDLELARLARYFGVVLDVVSDNYEKIYTAFGNFGRFPFLHGDLGKNIEEHQQLVIMSSLREREVLRDGNEYMNDQGIEFSMPDIELICRRLNAVPHVEMVDQFVSEHKKSLKGQPVPKNWPRSCTDELLQRTVIISDAERGGYVFAMSAEVAAFYTGAIPHCEEIKKICREHFQMRPRLVLCNKAGNHWENTIALPDPFFIEMIQRSGLFGQNGQPQFYANAAIVAALERQKKNEEVVHQFN